MTVSSHKKVSEAPKIRETSQRAVQEHGHWRLICQNKIPADIEHFFQLYITPFKLWLLSSGNHVHGNGMPHIYVCTYMEFSCIFICHVWLPEGKCPSSGQPSSWPLKISPWKIDFDSELLPSTNHNLSRPPWFWGCLQLHGTPKLDGRLMLTSKLQIVGFLYSFDSHRIQ